MDEGFLKKKDYIMYIIFEAIGVLIFILFLIATLIDVFSQLFPGLSAKEADMQDRVDIVKEAIKEYNMSEEIKK